MISPMEISYAVARRCERDTLVIGNHTKCRLVGEDEFGPLPRRGPLRGQRCRTAKNPVIGVMRGFLRKIHLSVAAAPFSDEI